jgi:Rrf2 family protein
VEISRKTDYAMRMLAALARQEDGILSVRIAADENDVPYSFARSIQHDLVRAGLVESLRGARGGMRLAVDPSDITLLQVVEAVQGPVDIATCDTAGPDGAPCPRMVDCHFNPIWRGARDLLVDYFSSVTLDQVVKGSKAPCISPDLCGPHAFDDLCAASARDLEQA